MFKEREDGQTHYCEECEVHARGKVSFPSKPHTCGKEVSTGKKSLQVQDTAGWEEELSAAWFDFASSYKSYGDMFKWWLEKVAAERQRAMEEDRLRIISELEVIKKAPPTKGMTGQHLRLENRVLDAVIGIIKSLTK